MGLGVGGWGNYLASSFHRRKGVTYLPHATRPLSDRAMLILVAVFFVLCSGEDGQENSGDMGVCLLDVLGTSILQETEGR